MPDETGARANVGRNEMVARPCSLKSAGDREELDGACCHLATSARPVGRRIDRTAPRVAIFRAVAARLLKCDSLYGARLTCSAVGNSDGIGIVTSPVATHSHPRVTIA